MLFHRGYLLRFERSLLVVDPSIEALPYWDYAKDTSTGECFQNPSCYIFSNDYFGGYYGSPNANYVVVDGLFANWPVAHFDEDLFGPTGELSTITNAPCIVEGWFKGSKANTCESCCGQDKDSCECGDEEIAIFLRNHADCTPFVARNPAEMSAIDRTRR
jgi:hypothetical protein